MGQRGRAPEPVALRVLKGETRPSQLSKAPKPQDPPEKPDDMDAAAGRVWDRVLAATAHTQHIGQPHADTFRAYCEAVSAANSWKPKGTKEWRDLINTARQLARELCLTPATGGHLAGKVTQERKLDRFIDRTG